MSRLLLPLAAFLLFPCLPGCGGGGGGAPQGTLAVDFGSLSTTGGEVLTFEAAAAGFASGQAFTGEWRQNGVVVAAGRWAAATGKALVTVVPTNVPAGDYEVVIGLGAARGQAVVQVAAAPVVGDPAAAVQAFRADLVSTFTSLRAEVAALRDPVVAASLTADLDRLEVVRTTFESALATASTAELQLLAVVRTATPMAFSGLLPQRDTGGVQANVDEARDLIVGHAAAWWQGAALVAAGVVIGADVGWSGSGAAFKAGLTVAGGLQMVDGVTGVAQAKDLLLRSVEANGLTFSFGSGEVPGSNEVVIPAVLAGSAASTLAVTVGAAYPLRAAASFATLSEADRSRPDARLQSIFTTMDGTATKQAGLAAAVAAMVQTSFPAVPLLPRIGLGTIHGAALTLVSQSNAQVALTLANGQLSATLQGASPATTTATFRYDAGSLGVLTGTATVEVIELLPNLVAIPAGTFAMGSGAYTVPIPWTANELPVHDVTFALPFWIGKFEVTQAEYQAVMGNNPSAFVAANRPVEQVTWYDAVAFCDALSVQEAAAGRLPAGYEYRLPTEAEWEYCCRAGTATEWSLGGGPGCATVNFFDESLSVLCVGQTADVGSYGANGWGLHDMHGNVWEWCLDAWDGSNNYSAGPVVDPYSTTGIYRVFRGGAWLLDSLACRSAVRGGYVPGGSGNSGGFRVVCAPVRD